ncbi:hypothetical protein ECG_08716 [Echinococcus granulosus]|nr:hypothetical protein ECG_08716 [Echinococcus granulosus]
MTCKSCRCGKALKTMRVECGAFVSACSGGGVGGEYELHLCYKRTYENVESLPATSTIEESKIRVNGSRRRLRFEELASIPDVEWLVNFDRSVYYLYPQSIPIRDTLQSLISGKPVTQPPIFNPHIRFLRVPSNVCPPLTNAQASNGLSDESSHPSVVLVYKSAVYNFEVRRQLRDLYHFSHPSISIHLIFSIALPRTSPGLTPELRDNLSYGYSMMENPVHRFNSTSKYPQWAFSKREIPWPSHTPEHLGIYSVWSYRHVHDMALAMHFTKPMVIDDTWFAMVQYKLNLTFTKLKGMLFETMRLPKQLNCSDMIFALTSVFKQRRCAL